MMPVYQHTCTKRVRRHAGITTPNELIAFPRFSSGIAGKPCLTLTVTGGGKFSAEDEAEAIQSKILEEISGSQEGDDLPPSSRKTCVRLATPPELYCPSEGRDVFPQKLLRLAGGPSHLLPKH